MIYKFLDSDEEKKQCLEVEQLCEDYCLITAIEDERIYYENYIRIYLDKNGLKDLIDSLNVIYSKLNTNQDG